MTASLPLFGDCLLPEVALPSIGFLSKPCGEWCRYCPGWTGFNAILPISWSV